MQLTYSNGDVVTPINRHRYSDAGCDLAVGAVKKKLTAVK